MQTIGIGAEDFQDIMTGVDAVIEKRGVADAEKLGVMGWSWRFHDLVDYYTDEAIQSRLGRCGVTNLLSFNGTADIPSFIPDYQW